MKTSAALLGLGLVAAALLPAGVLAHPGHGGWAVADEDDDDASGSSSSGKGGKSGGSGGSKCGKSGGPCSGSSSGPDDDGGYGPVWGPPPGWGIGPPPGWGWPADDDASSSSSSDGPVWGHPGHHHGNWGHWGPPPGHHHGYYGPGYGPYYGWSSSSSSSHSSSSSSSSSYSSSSSSYSSSSSSYSSYSGKGGKPGYWGYWGSDKGGKSKSKGGKSGSKCGKSGHGKSKSKGAKSKSKCGKSGGSCSSSPDYDCQDRSEASAYRTCLDRSCGFDSSDIVHDYERPHLEDGEEIVAGTLQLALLEDDTNLSCRRIKDAEELVLRYLADNVGGGESEFEPACVQVTDNAFDRQALPRGAERFGYVESNVLELRVSYVQGPGRRALRGDGEEHERNTEEGVDGAVKTRALQGCSPVDRAVCCSQAAINASPERGRDCVARGCGPQNCGGGRRTPATRRPGAATSALPGARRPGAATSALPGARRRDLRAASGDLEGVGFVRAVRQNTSFRPREADAHVLGGNVDEVAACSVNRYSLETFRTPTLTCPEFFAEDCEANDDLLPVVDPENGGCLREPSSKSAKCGKSGCKSGKSGDKSGKSGN